MKKSKTTQLDELARKINEGHTGSSRPWQGARVIIADVAPEPTPPGFYPEPTTVVTPHVNELSWLFEQLRDVAIELEGYGMWKEEYFGRLAVAASKVPGDQSVAVLLLATMREAYELLGMTEIGMEMSEFSIVVQHPRTLGRGIGDFDLDHLRAFYAGRGITLH